MLYYAPINVKPEGGVADKGWGFDFFGKFLVKFPTLGIEIWVKLNQIPPPRTISSESAYVFMDHLGPRLRSNSREWGSQERSNAPHLPPPLGLNIDRCIMEDRHLSNLSKLECTISTKSVV